MKYLVVYDLETKKNTAKICNEDDVADIVDYARFLKARNIIVYIVDFENELISEVFRDEESICD